MVRKILRGFLVLLCVAVVLAIAVYAYRPVQLTFVRFIHVSVGSGLKQHDRVVAIYRVTNRGVTTIVYWGAGWGHAGNPDPDWICRYRDIGRWRTAHSGFDEPAFSSLKPGESMEVRLPDPRSFLGEPAPPDFKPMMGFGFRSFNIPLRENTISGLIDLMLGRLTDHIFWFTPVSTDSELAKH